MNICKQNFNDFTLSLAGVSLPGYYGCHQSDMHEPEDGPISYNPPLGLEAPLGHGGLAHVPPLLNHRLDVYQGGCVRPHLSN